MISTTNPITEPLHLKWESELRAIFPQLRKENSEIFLILRKYVISDHTERFYSVKVFNEYLSFLNQAKDDKPQSLAKVLNTYKKEIDVSYRTLSEINLMDIHDNKPSNSNLLLNFIDKKIHFPLLQIIEKPYFIPLLICENYVRQIQNKGAEKMDLFNVVVEGNIKKTSLELITRIYNHTFRNSIAHGSYYYRDDEIDYIDKNKTISIGLNDVIRMFDDLVDYSNGMYLALIIFFLTNTEYLKIYSINIPTSILVEELKYRVKSPFWKLNDCLSSRNLNNTNQITLYTETGTPSFDKVYLSAFHSALLAEKYLYPIDRIFVNIGSKFKYIHGGFLAFDANKLRKFRESEYINTHFLDKICEDNILFHTQINPPKFIQKIETIWHVLTIQLKVNFDRSIWKKFIIRGNNIHSKSTGDVVINDAKVILNSLEVSDYEDFIRVNYRKIIRQTIKDAKMKTRIFSFAKILPVTYIRILIYDSDERLRYSKGKKHLIASILWNKSRRIKTIDLAGGQLEIIDGYRISWNHKRELY